MRSVFSRIAVMLRNIHFGGASSGIRAIQLSKSNPPLPDARRLATQAPPARAAPTITSFFVFPYQWNGLTACLWVSTGFLLAAGLLSLLLPSEVVRSTRPAQVSQTA